MAAPTSFQDLLDDSYLWSLELQRRLSEVAGEGTAYDGSFDVDLATGTLRFSGAQVLEVRTHFLGSAAPGPGTWLWGWHNLNGYPDHVVATAQRLRDDGERWGIVELTSAEVPLVDAPRVEAGRRGAVAGVLAGGLPLYTFEVGGGTVAAVLLEHPLLVLAPATAQQAMATVTHGLGYDPATVADWRRALTTYGQRRGLRVDPRPDGELWLAAADGHVAVGFDEHGRIASLQGRLLPR